MVEKKERALHRLNLVLSVTAFVLLAGLSTAWAQQPWTSVGAAGTVDTNSLLLVVYGAPPPPLPPTEADPDDGAVSFAPLATGTATVRYNVVSVPGILGASLALTGRYLSQGTNDHVVLNFNQYNLHTGLITNLLTLDSNSFAFSDTFQVQTTAACTPGPVDFVNNSYYIVLTMTRTLPPSTFPIPPITSFNAPRPSLGMIQLSPCTTIF